MLVACNSHFFLKLDIEGILKQLQSELSLNKLGYQDSNNRKLNEQTHTTIAFRRMFSSKILVKGYAWRSPPNKFLKNISGPM